MNFVNLAEYGTGFKVSIEADVYSYGVILLEMVIGKRPTDEMFQDSMNIHNFVEAAFPERIVEMFDSNLTIHDEGEGEIFAAVRKQWSVIQLAKLGLKCSETSPKNRPTMEYVYAEIITIKEKLQRCTYQEK